MNLDCSEEAKEIGRIQGEMSALKEDVHEMKADIKSILKFVNETKGGWKTIAVIAGCSSAFTMFAIKFLPFIPFKP